MNSTDKQIRLSESQVDAFYHTDFVDDQVRDFLDLTARHVLDGVVVDIGGGVGHFADRLAGAEEIETRVIDTDPISITRCKTRGLDALLGDALSPPFIGDEQAASFNLVLHHLVGSNEQATRRLQVQALRVWSDKARFIFVQEYIYESYIGYVSGRLIFAITSSRLLSALGSIVARVIPAFRANTFGTGVRFRAHQEWKTLFTEAGFQVADARIGRPDKVAAPLRALLIREIRRDSFLLERIVPK
jgi:hypothetical protein